VVESVPQLWLEPLAPLAGGLEPLSGEERRWGAALPESRRLQYWASRAALRRRLAALLNCPPADLPLQAPPGSPPQLGHGAGWLSLSHCGTHAGVALLIAWSPTPIGVDLEWAGRGLKARPLMTRFFPEPERRQLADLAEDRLHEAVLRSWVLKEAAIKWRWRSLALELSQWRFDHQSGELGHGREGLSAGWRAGLVGRWRWAAVGSGVEGLELHAAAWLTQSGLVYRPRDLRAKSLQLLQD
jgi:4'-phosphopantetheinyl transferase